MAENRRTRVSPKQETPATLKQGDRYGYRYAYARALESRSPGDTGQDYLVIFEDETRLAFALCDGVSQSFYGDLAARLLGDALVDWMFNAPAYESSGELEANLTQFLQLLTEQGTRQVKEFRLPENLAPMIQNALDRKRAIGSESTLIAGRVDLDAGEIILAWLGDSNLRIWGPAGEKTAVLGETFLMQERWSSSKGPVGHVHAFVGSLGQVTRFAAYSDGLEKLNHRLKWGVPSNHAIDVHIEEAGEDDSSLFEFWVGAFPGLNIATPGKPAGLHAALKDDLFRASWQPAAKASLYDLEMRTKAGESIYWQTSLPLIELPARELPAYIESLRVRTWQGEEPGEWSDAVPFRPAVVQPAPERVEPIIAPPPVVPLPLQPIPAPPIEPSPRQPIPIPPVEPPTTPPVPAPAPAPQVYRPVQLPTLPAEPPRQPVAAPPSYKPPVSKPVIQFPEPASKKRRTILIAGLSALAAMLLLLCVVFVRVITPDPTSTPPVQPAEMTRSFTVQQMKTASATPSSTVKATKSPVASETPTSPPTILASPAEALTGSLLTIPSNTATWTPKPSEIDSP